MVSIKSQSDNKRLTVLHVCVCERKGHFRGIFFTFFRDTAGQERFRTITTAYYRGAMVRITLTPVGLHKYIRKKYEKLTIHVLYFCRASCWFMTSRMKNRLRTSGIGYETLKR